MENETGKSKSCEWETREEKNVWNKKTQGAGLIFGVTFCILAIIFNLYLFAIVIVLSTFILIALGKRSPRIFHFLITEEGFKVDDKFYEVEHISGFNIIDDPTDKGRLTISMKDLVGQITVPIYDVDVEAAEECFVAMNIKKDEGLKISFLDRYTRFF